MEEGNERVHCEVGHVQRGKETPREEVTGRAKREQEKKTKETCEGDRPGAMK